MECLLSFHSLKLIQVNNLKKIIHAAFYVFIFSLFIYKGICIRILNTKILKKKN